MRSVGARDRGRRRTSFSSCHKLLRPGFTFVLAIDSASPETLGGALFIVDGPRMSLRQAEIPPPYAGGAGSGSVSEGLGSLGIVRRELNLGRSGERVLCARPGEAARGLFASKLATPARGGLVEGRVKGALEALDAGRGASSASSSVGAAGRMMRLAGNTLRARGAKVAPRGAAGGCLGPDDRSSRYRA